MLGLKVRVNPTARVRMKDGLSQSCRFVIIKKMPITASTHTPKDRQRRCSVCVNAYKNIYCAVSFNSLLLMNEIDLKRVAQVGLSVNRNC